MLEELLKHDRLGNREELLFFLFDSLSAGNGQALTSVQKYCISNVFSISGSFNGIDRFIEVKSYDREVSFFWSRNEVEKAKELKGKYYLYLVDRSRIKENDYKPQQFQDPYKKVFENEIWRKQT